MPAEPVLITPLVEESAMVFKKTCAEPELFASEPNVVELAPTCVSVKVRFTEASNVMSEIVRVRLTPLAVPDPAFVNSTESLFAG